MNEEAKDILERIGLELRPIREDIRELKKSQDKLVEVITKFATLESKVNHDNSKNEEARRVLHKRIDNLEKKISEYEDMINKRFDKLFKILFWFGTFLISSLVGLIYRIAL